MTKTEAIQAMQEGKKVTHRYFSPDEYIRSDGRRIYTEENYSCTHYEFWAMRDGEAWETDWELFTKDTPYGSMPISRDTYKHTDTKTDWVDAQLWWQNVSMKDSEAIANKYFPDREWPTLTTQDVLVMWRSETQSPALEEKSGDLLCTPGEWELHLGRHKEGTPIFGWGIRVNGKAAHLALQGLYEANNAVGMGLNDEPIDILFTPEEAEANARLIAASKDLYNALAELYKAVLTCRDNKEALGKTILALKKANPSYSPQDHLTS